MKGKSISDALGTVNEAYIAESAPKKTRKKRRWVAAVAAVLVVAIGLGIFFGRGRPLSIDPVPGVIQSFARSTPVYPETAPYPLSELDPGAEEWFKSRQERWVYRGAGADLFGFFADSTGAVFENRQENTVYSPVSAFMALAMLAECTGGETRAQILRALGVQSIEALREKANSVWNANYSNDGAVTSILGNSVWLNKSVTWEQPVLDTLAETYYAAAFSGKFSDRSYQKAMRAWLNEQTGNLLEDSVNNIEMDAETVLALLSTVCFRGKWSHEFSKQQTYAETFYAPAGEQTADFMHETEEHGLYYWGDRYGAVSLNVKEGGTLWLFLPDEGVSAETLLSDPQVWELLSHDANRLVDYTLGEYERMKSMIVHLALPKFDVACETDLAPVMRQLGITNCFDASAADFSPLTTDTAIALSQATHAARVAIDEQGITATAYTAMIGVGAAMPPTEEIDFVLDRPFAFVLTGLDNLPLFAGTVFSVV